jgi:choice-of-anchor B domain-containing protein
MNVVKRLIPYATVLSVWAVCFAHDDTLGARFVQPDGANATDCLDHDVPCQTIQYALAQAEPGNTVKVGAGIYDMSGVPPESFLFGTIKAAGGYKEADHFGHSDPDANKTIIYGVDPQYRQAVMRQGFKWAADQAAAQAGQTDDSPARALQATQLAVTACMQGFAGQFPCRNVDFQAQIPLNSFSRQPISASNLWGFVDLNDNREYAVIGLSNGTAIVEVTNPSSPREVALISGNNSSWREVKIYQYRDAAANRYRAYAYISTEAVGSGVQVLDLSGLPNTASLAATLMDTSSQHTLYISNIDYGTNVALPGEEAFLYVAGSNQNLGSWRVYSLANPAQPQLITAAPLGTQYMHDSTSLYITDNRTTQCDQGHNPCQVLVDFNENSVDLWDVTNKTAPVKLSSTTYPSVQYTHSGWPSADQRFVFFHDELEEIRRGLNTQIYTMDIGDLRAPSIVTSYQGPNTTTDHNGYTRGNFYYVSHYRRGLVVFDVSNPNQLREVAAFDTFLSPAADAAGTDGAWGVYPFLPSGTVLISDISNGLFVLKPNVEGLANSVGRLSFIGTNTRVSEGTGSATVRVQRNAGYAGAVTIQYSTSDDTATAGSDYTAQTGSLSWAAGDVTEKSITLQLNNDSQDEADEAIKVTLSNPTGGATIEGAVTFLVTVTNDDGTAPPSNGGGGGGGALGVDLLALLAVCFAAQRRWRRAWRIPGAGMHASCCGL